MEKILAGKKIVLGITGSIAAYKTVDWLRNLRKAGAEVTVIMTASARKFVTALTFSALSAQKVHTDMFDPHGAEEIPHISLGQNCDLIIIAPATAQTIARLANGLADDLLSAVVLAASCPVMICPAMNSKMYLNQATQDNLAKLWRYGYHITEPDSGEMACGDYGPGRLPEWSKAQEKIISYFVPQDLAGQTVLVTAGPTHEPLDPVRFLSNRSSGKMGYAIARAAKLRGAKVYLVSGPTSLTPPPDVETAKVTTAAEMYAATLRLLDQATIVVKSAAVSDYRPVNCSTEKIKKGAASMDLPLTANADILLELGKRAKQLSPRPFLVGFAAESTSHIEEGLRKLKSKDLDMIVVNDIVAEDRGFAAETNKVTIIGKTGQQKELPLLTKDETAMSIFDEVLKSIS